MNTSTEQATIYLSKKGMKELKKQIASTERLLHHTQQELRNLDKSDSREDRFDRIEMQSRIEMIESDLAEKRQQMRMAKLLPRKRDALKVALGSVVDLVDTSGRMVQYTLVDSLEANPSDGRISIHSPLGKNLIGRTIQDTIEWSVGLRAKQLKLVQIQ